MKINDTIPCPVCGQSIHLVQKPGNASRLIAYHACGGQPKRPVYETDAQPVAEEQVLAMPAPSGRGKRKKK